MVEFTYNGYVYDERTDWNQMVREGARGGWGRGLRTDVGSAAEAMGDFETSLRESPSLFERYADAALNVIEAGSADDVKAVLSLSWDAAPNAKDRVLRQLEHGRARLDGIGPTVARTLLTKMLDIYPTDARLLAVLRDELDRKPTPAVLIERAAWHLPDWFAANLQQLVPAAPRPRDLYFWLARVPDEKLDVVLDAVVRAGFGPQLREALTMTPINEDVRERVTLHARRHPLLAGQFPSA
jgi:hypothetical protein